MAWTARIVEPPSVFGKMMTEVVRRSYNKNSMQIAASVTKKAKALFVKAMVSSNTYASLTGRLGPHGLMGHLGIGRADVRKVDGVIAYWADQIKVIARPLSSHLHGGITIQMMSTDFQDAIRQPFAMQENTSKNSSARRTLPWLQWMLLQGASSTLVRDYHYDASSTEGRSGFGIMIGGGSWGVPRQPDGIAGTVHNNWVTHTLDQIDDDLSRIIINEIIRTL